MPLPHQPPNIPPTEQTSEFQELFKNIVGFYQAMAVLPLHSAGEELVLPSALKLAAELFTGKNIIGENGVSVKGELFLIEGALKFLSAHDISQTLSDADKNQALGGSLVFLIEAPAQLMQIATILELCKVSWSSKEPKINLAMIAIDAQNEQPGFTIKLLVNKLRDYARAFEQGHTYTDPTDTQIYLPPIMEDLKKLQEKLTGKA